MRVPVSTKHMGLFECLSSRTRVEIIELLGYGPKNIGELADILNVSSSIITRHISILQEAAIVSTESLPGKRGLQKICSLAANEITLVFKKEAQVKNCHTISIPVGQYTAYDVLPACGLASLDGFIGICDDPRYFSDPEHVNAALLWFQTGWVEYRIPSFILTPQPIHAIEISLEICSEFPIYKEDWPSDIHFYINDILLGVWTSPGDFGDKKGVYTPDWWRTGTQYGLLKTIRITSQGTMLDGVPLSDVTVDRLPIQRGKDLYFKIAVPKDSRNPGGVNIFGKGFGNYDQDIEVRVEY